MPFSKISRLEKAIESATSYAEWKRAALDLDHAKGMDKWKLADNSPHFDHRSIRARLEHLRNLRSSKDWQGLLYALNEGIHGNMGGMGKSQLYHEAMVGTKKVIEDYVDEVVLCLHLLSQQPGDLDGDELYDFFQRASHCFGQSALMMSGSGTLAYFHLGMIKALWKENLLPKILSGTSGGALIGSILATHTDDELGEFLSADKFVSKDAAKEGWLERYKFKVISAADFREMVDSLVPDLTFLEAFEKTGRSINISIAPAQAHQTSRLLNAITTPYVLIREAIMASCAVPGIFPAVTLRAKNRDGVNTDYLPHRQWVDGAMSDDLPAKRLSRLYGVNHFIVSQTNPHILPFISDAKPGVTGILTRAASNTAREWLNAGVNLLHAPMSKFPTVHHMSNSVMSVINQDYMGDINIIPPFRFPNPARVLAPLTEAEIGELIEMGQRTTWPKIEMIRTQTKISRCLDEILLEYDGAPLKHKKSNIVRLA